MEWIPPVITWAVVILFTLFLFARGPKGRIARIRCALRGHFWAPSLKTEPVEKDGKPAIAIEISFKCLGCKEVVSIKSGVSFELVGEDGSDPVVFPGSIGGNN